MRKIFAAIAMLGLSYATASSAAPFGLKMGARPPELDILRDNHDGTVVLSTVPRAFPGLAQFFARFDTSHGLCSIAGVSRPFENDPLGLAARDYYLQLERRLTDLYGESSAYDFARPGA